MDIYLFSIWMFPPIQMSVIQIPTVVIFKPPEFALQRNIERVS